MKVVGSHGRDWKIPMTRIPNLQKWVQSVSTPLRGVTIVCKKLTLVGTISPLLCNRFFPSGCLNNRSVDSVVFLSIWFLTCWFNDLAAKIIGGHKSLEGSQIWDSILWLPPNPPNAVGGSSIYKNQVLCRLILYFPSRCLGIRHEWPKGKTGDDFLHPFMEMTPSD